jgi:anti-sigma regulatory factor (Ser/Thr protein kinase)
MSSDSSVAEMGFGLADLFSLRRLVAGRAREAGMSAHRADELALATNEIATNALVHGRPPATLRIWLRDHEIVCEVTDSGRGIRDRHAGRVRPMANSPRGRGLWLARQLCDSVVIRNGTGCTVSLHMSVPAAVPASA